MFSLPSGLEDAWGRGPDFPCCSLNQPHISFPHPETKKPTEPLRGQQAERGQGQTLCIYPGSWASRVFHHLLIPETPHKTRFPGPSPGQTSQIRDIPLGVRDVNSVSK